METVEPMNFFYVNITLEDWSAVSISDEELQLLLEGETNRRYREFLDVLV